MNSQSPWKRSFRRLRKDRQAMLSAFFIFLMVLVALFAPQLSPYDPEFQNSGSLTLSPNASHFFGTDTLGRDVFSRVLSGSRVSMAVAFTTALSGLLLGCLYGGIAGLAGGMLDASLMSVLDLFYTLPTLLLLIFLNVLFGQGLTGILIALSLEGMITVARLVRGQVFQLRDADFVIAARAIGVRPFSVLIRHLFPNILGPIVVTLTFLIPSNIMYEAFLSFIGLGIQPPYSSWGTLANEGWRGLVSYPHLIIFPGVAIFITMLAFNFFGDGLRDAFDPKSLT